MDMYGYYQTKLNEHDVLYARGNGANNTIGNKRYRKEIRDYKLSYQTNARNNKEKELIARKVMEKIRLRGGRFFHYPTEGGQLCDAPDHIVLSKVKQALREKKKNTRLCGISNMNSSMMQNRQEDSRTINQPSHVEEQKEDDDEDHSISFEKNTQDKDMKEGHGDDYSISIDDITDNLTNSNDESLIQFMGYSSFQDESTDNNCFLDYDDSISTFDVDTNAESPISNVKESIIRETNDNNKEDTRQEQHMAEDNFIESANEEWLSNKKRRISLPCLEKRENTEGFTELFVNKNDRIGEFVHQRITRENNEKVL
jgi:hypothetical protein